MAVDGTSGPKDQPRFLPGGAFEDWVDLGAVGDYAALVGNRKALTRAQRLALTGKTVWEGLTVQETDGDYNVFTYLGGAWKFISSPLQSTAGLNYAGSGAFGNNAAMDIVKVNGFVMANFAIEKVSGFSDGDVPGTFPVGFRPVKYVSGEGSFADDGVGTARGSFSIATNGTVTISGDSGGRKKFFAPVFFRVTTPT